VVENVGEAMKQLMDTLIDPEMRKSRVDEDLTGVNLPLEEVQLADEKVNYRIALNPEIFFRYTVFKARVASLGRKWDGTFSDWIDMATKDILAVYGMYPTVTTKGKSFTVDIPTGVQPGEVE
jgi:hypothetical protein